MKILLDARLYGLENAGLGRYITNLVSGLSATDKKNSYVILLRRKYFDRLDFPANWKKVLADYRHYGFREQIFLPFLILREKPDLVHFPHFNIPILYKGRFVVTIHDTLMHQQKGLDATTLPAPLYFLKRLAYHFVFKNAVTRAQFIIVPSIAVKDDLIDKYKIDRKRLGVTYEGVDKKITGRHRPKVQKPYFVYVGNAYPHKNLDRLIEATIQLNKNYNHKITLAIGSARTIFTQRLESLIRKHKATNCVQLLGFVKDDELGALFKESTGFVFPSLSEGFGLPGLEAMQAQTLVLASNIPVFKEVYGDHVLYFNPRETTSIARVMQDALELSLNERHKLIESGQKFVKRYSWAKMAQQTLSIYETEGSKGSNSIR